MKLNLTTDEAQALVDILGDAEATNDEAVYLKEKILRASREDDEQPISFKAFLERARNQTPFGA